MILTLDVGLALAPWNVLGGGKIRTDEEEERRRASGEGGRSVFSGWERNETERKVSHALEKVAAEVGAKSITSGEYISFVQQPRLKCCGSGYRIPHAEGTIRFPHHRRTQGRAPPRQHRGTRYFAEPRANRLPRQPRAIPQGLPVRSLRECIGLYLLSPS